MKTNKEQQVWLACQNLFQQGFTVKQISARRIQEELISLGWSKGSLRDIYQYKKTWAEKKGKARENAEELPLNALPTTHKLNSLENENQLLQEKLSDVSLELIAMQKKYQSLLEEHQALLEKSHMLHLQAQNGQRPQRGRTDASEELQAVVKFYEDKLETLRGENTELQLALSDLKQSMEHKRHEYIVQIDKLKVEKDKLQKLVDRHVLNL